MSLLLQQHKATRESIMCSYRGSLAIFNDQLIFDNTFGTVVYMYKISNEVTNKVNIFEQDRKDKDITDTNEGIKVEELIHACKKYYVRSNSPELRRLILTATPAAITSIKSQFTHPVTKHKITLSLDNIFKMIADYVILSPNDATMWMFSLIETFFCALATAMQTDMLQHNFSMPAVSRGDLKMEQLQSLNVVHASAIESH